MVRINKQMENMNKNNENYLKNHPDILGVKHTNSKMKNLLDVLLVTWVLGTSQDRNQDCTHSIRTQAKFYWIAHAGKRKSVQGEKRWMLLPQQKLGNSFKRVEAETMTPEPDL